MKRYFEDFAVGQTFQTGEATISRDEIIAFAREYDPQPFHLDPDLAAKSVFGELVASGWHTAAIVMRLIVESRVMEATGVIGRGVDELRWTAPVRPGDTLHCILEVAELIPSRSGSRRGTMRVKITALNQRNEPVMTSSPNLIVAYRPATVE